MNRSLISLVTAVLLAAACGGDSPTATPGPLAAAPAVSSTSPSNLATGITRNANVRATFTEPMDVATITTATFTLSAGAVVIPGVVTYSGVTAIFEPTASLDANTVYTASVLVGAEDVGGDPMVAVKTWTFTTVASSATGPAEVNLGTAGNYVILAKSAVSTTGSTAVVGNIGLSPAAATFITGFSLSAPATTSSTSPLVTGLVFAANYNTPTPANLTTAILDMQTAYTNAAGRTSPDFTELAAGNLNGKILVAGLYKWGTSVSFTSNVTLNGGANDVWIFQIAQNLTVGNGATVTLTGGALPENVFWQVAGQATLGTTSAFKGIILSKTLISFNTGSTIVGRALAQTAVTLNATTVTNP
jgi:hypothetical protein